VGVRKLKDINKIATQSAKTTYDWGRRVSVLLTLREHLSSSPVFFVGSVLLIFLVFCVVLLYVCTLWVPCIVVYNTYCVVFLFCFVFLRLVCQFLWIILFCYCPFGIDLILITWFTDIFDFLPVWNLYDIGFYRKEKRDSFHVYKSENVMVTFIYFDQLPT
jgi:hypothetical protein